MSTLVIPVTAIRTGGNGDFVYVIHPDRTVKQRTVIRGMSTVEYVAITTGLKEGELVVTEGADRLKDGAAVALQGDTPNQAHGASNGRRGGGGAGGGGRRGAGHQDGIAPAGSADAAPAAPTVPPSPAGVEPNAKQPTPAASPTPVPADPSKDGSHADPRNGGPASAGAGTGAATGGRPQSAQ